MENRYDKYKDSGIAWIREIPEHWEVKRMKSIYNFGKGLNITKADLVDKGIPVISYGQIHSKLNTGTCIKDSLIKYVPEIFFENNNTSLVKKGDIIFADTSEDLEGCGNCIYIDRDMLLYAGYHTIIAKNISTYINKYFSYLFQTDCWRTQIRRTVNGVKLFSIPQRLLASTDIITPSTQEQQSIATYLDQKCSEIDELITLQEEMIT
ncbi:restriction endonuclease subunit S, partial [uncultured Bacteroides sp.]|uniref:restriction endonuclease subunit S n=1 Tax=uncultured Bacteroides sp. TaxID=162156 RepID=UPI002592D8DB